MESVTTEKGVKSRKILDTYSMVVNQTLSFWEKFEIKL